MWMRLLPHVTNIHCWLPAYPGDPGRCWHDSLSEHERPWFSPTSAAFKEVRNVITDMRKLKRMHFFKKFRHTGALENYHNLTLGYAAKRFVYDYVALRARTQLATIDHNKHVGRRQRVDKNGQPVFSRRFNKRSRRYATIPVKAGKQYTYLPDLLALAFAKRAVDPERVDSAMPLPPGHPKLIKPSIVSGEQPSVKELVEKHQSRFSASRPVV